MNRNKIIALGIVLAVIITVIIAGIMMKRENKKGTSLTGTQKSG